MEIKTLDIPDLYLFVPQVFQDHRGFFMESYNKRDLAAQGLDIDFVQDNHALSFEAGVVRGLHYQAYPMAQTKLVRCVRGEIFDVAVDLREHSSTFGEWVGVTLNEDNKKQLFVPRGFAHGYCTMTPHTEVLYKVDNYYSPEHDAGIRWDDPTLHVDWPIQHPILSNKDQQLPSLSEASINR